MAAWSVLKEIKVCAPSVTERNACPSYFVVRNVFPPYVIETETSVQRVIEVKVCPTYLIQRIKHPVYVIEISV